MNNLCFVSNLSGEQWAAWVQAVGSVIAIGATGFAAWYQSKEQHKSAMSLYRTEKRQARSELTLTLGRLAKSCHAICADFCQQLSNEEAICNIATGATHIDMAELGAIEKALEAVPLIGLPHNLVTTPLLLRSYIRQFRENCELVIEKYSVLSSDECGEFCKTIAKIRDALGKASGDINTAINDLSEITS